MSIEPLKRETGFLADDLSSEEIALSGIESGEENPSAGFTEPSTKGPSSESVPEVGVIEAPIVPEVREIKNTISLPSWAEDFKKSIIKELGGYYKNGLSDDSDKKIFDKNADQAMVELIELVSKNISPSEEEIANILKKWLKPTQAGESDAFFLDVRRTLIYQLLNSLAKDTNGSDLSL